MRARVRAARRHPAARARLLYRWQMQRLMSFGVVMVRAGCGTVAHWLCAFTLATVAKFSPGSIPVPIQRRDGLAVRLAVAATLATLAAACVAAWSMTAVAELRIIHPTDTRPVATPVRGPGLASRLARLGRYAM
ncbi:hypothetical protein QCZ28_33985 [Micromonospora sp. DH14]|nr:hypothetical protein [Micromonospora sp. DH14]